MDSCRASGFFSAPINYNDYDAFNCGIVASESAQSSTPYSLQFAVH